MQPLTFLTLFLPRRDDLSAIRALDRLNVRLCNLFRRHAALGILPHGLQRLRNPGWAHDVDPDAARRFERGGAYEALEARIHQAHRRAPAHRLLGENPTR